jgi:hypothetical protein
MKVNTHDINEMINGEATYWIAGDFRELSTNKQAKLYNALNFNASSLKQCYETEFPDLEVRAYFQQQLTKVIAEHEEVMYG